MPEGTIYNHDEVVSDIEFLESWVQALRSCIYDQGDGFLCSETEEGSRKYCCLGVLGDLGEQDGRYKGWLDIDSNLCRFAWDPPEVEVAKETSLVNVSLDVSRMLAKYGIISADLVSMNDAGVPFEEIADLIEEDLNEFKQRYGESLDQGPSKSEVPTGFHVPKE